MHLIFATEPAHASRPNEDFVGATPEAVVLLDGAGHPSGMASGCSHGVAWYSHTLGSTLLATLGNSSGQFDEVLAESIKTVSSRHGAICDLVC
ncbi:hypothetical protein [Nonomuraea sp. NEAU-A123]|uniref:hypothetical protein n=1 Tax=Nonomuraea sp. NEAU-A123 TaxID=2839649 RepID=UPI001BE453C6|nr:hypothetical protein [Nonomuraea sp. NEAU-A123]MBT2226435.1 hypothetical protein [Nonomuraea sp. NEAU-A123]